MFRLNTYLVHRGFKNTDPHFGYGKTNAIWKHDNGIKVERRLESNSIYVYIKLFNTFIGRYCINCKDKEKHVIDFKAKLEQVMQSPMDALKHRQCNEQINILDDIHYKM